MMCVKCKLAETRRRIVSWRGSTSTLGPVDVLYMGEGPGRSEDLIGIPFVGVAGKLFDKLVSEVPDHPSWIVTNTVFCRPCDDKRGPNRQPSAVEVLACQPNVEVIIVAANPRLVVFLGQVAATYYRSLLSRFPSIVLPHPAYLARTGGRASPHYAGALRLLKEAIDEQAESEHHDGPEWL